MTESTDRVLASIDETLDGYVSEDWAVSDDAMRWRPDEPERPAPTWVDIAEHVIVRPPYQPEAWCTSWAGGHSILVALDEAQRFFRDQILTFTLDLSWCNWGSPEEAADVEPHWDDSLEASLNRTCSGAPEGGRFWSGPAAVARAEIAIEEAMRAKFRPAPEPLSATWRINGI